MDGVGQVGESDTGVSHEHEFLKVRGGQKDVAALAEAQGDDNRAARSG